jgi:hypothetical protein
MTQCLSCQQVSPHEAWYHYPADDEPARERDRTLEITTSSFDGWRGSLFAFWNRLSSA